MDVLFLLSFISTDEVGPLGNLRVALEQQQEEEEEGVTTDLWSGYPLDKVNTPLLYLHYRSNIISNWN